MQRWKTILFCNDPSAEAEAELGREVEVLARGKGKADEKITCISPAHDFQTSKGTWGARGFTECLLIFFYLSSLMRP